MEQGQQTGIKPKLELKKYLNFESILKIDLYEIEDSLNLTNNISYPFHMKSVLQLISAQEHKLKSVYKTGIHSESCWLISKKLSFLYFVVSYQLLFRNKYQNYQIFNKKSLFVIEPPSSDSIWTSKQDWKLLQLLNLSYYGLLLCKTGQIDAIGKLYKSVGPLINDLCKLGRFNSIVGRCRLCFGVIQKQLKDIGYLEGYKQAAHLIYSDQSTRVEKRVLIGYLVYKYAKKSKNYKDSVNLIDSSVRLLQQYQLNSQDEKTVVEKLQGLKTNIKVHREMVKNNRNVGFDKIMVSNKMVDLSIQNYMEREKTQYLDESDINVFEQITGINKKPQKQQIVNIGGKNSQKFMIKNSNKYHSSKGLLNMKTNNIANTNNCSSNKQQSISQLKMGQIYGGGSKKKQPKSGWDSQIVRIKQKDQLIDKSYEMLIRPNRMPFTTRLLDRSQLINTTQKQLQIQKHFQSQRANPKNQESLLQQQVIQEYEYSFSNLDGQQFKEEQGQSNVKEQQVESNVKQDQSLQIESVREDENLSRVLGVFETVNGQSHKSYIASKKKEEDNDDLNIFDSNIHKKMVDYIADEIQTLNDEDELFNDHKQTSSNKIQFNQLNLDIFYKLDNLELQTQKVDQQTHDKNSQEVVFKQQHRTSKPKITERQAIYVVQSFFRKLIKMKKWQQTQQEQIMKVKMNQKNFVKRQKSSTVNLFFEDHYQKQYKGIIRTIVFERKCKSVDRKLDKTDKEFKLKQKKQVKKIYKVNFVHLKEERKNKISRKLKEIFDNCLQKCDWRQNQKDDGQIVKIDFSVIIQERFYKFQVLHKIVQNSLEIEYNLIFRNCSQRFTLKINITKQMQKQIYQQKLENKIVKILLSYLQTNISNKQFQNLQVILENCLNKYDMIDKLMDYRKLLIIQKRLVIQFGLIQQKQIGYIYKMMLVASNGKKMNKKLIQYSQQLYQLNMMMKRVRIYHLSQVSSVYQSQSQYQKINYEYRKNSYQLTRQLIIRSNQPFFIVYLVKLQQQFRLMTVKFTFNRQFAFYCIQQVTSIGKFRKNNFEDIFDRLKMKFTFRIEKMERRESEYRELELDTNFVKNQFNNQKLFRYIVGYLFRGKYYKNFILRIIEIIDRFIFVKGQKIFHKYLTKDQKLFTNIDEERLISQQSQPMKLNVKSQGSKVEDKNQISQMFEYNFDSIYSKDFRNRRESLFEIKDELGSQKQTVEILAYQNNSHDNVRNYVRQNQNDSRCGWKLSLSRESSAVYLRIHNKENNLIYIFKISKTQSSCQNIYISYLSQIHKVNKIGDKKIYKILQNSLQMRSMASLNVRAIQNSTVLSCFKCIKKLNGSNYQAQVSQDSDTINSTLILQSFTSLKTNVIKDTQQMSQKFLQQSYHFLDKFKRIGKCMVTINIYSNKKQQIQKEFNFFVSFKIYPYSCKTKVYKFILDKYDIEKHFGTDMDFQHFSTMNSRCFIKKMKKIFQKMTLIRSSLYYQMVLLPSEEQQLFYNSQKKMHLQQFKWNRNQFIKHDMNNKIAKNKHFLDDYVNEKRVIGQYIKKVNNLYLIITVSKSLLLEDWSVQVYTPKGSRKYQAYIQKTDFLKYQKNQFSSIFPFNYYNVSQIGTQFVDYKQFLEDMQVFQKEVRKSVDDYKKRTDGKGFNFKSRYIVDRMLGLIGKKDRVEEQNSKEGSLVNKYQELSLQQILARFKGNKAQGIGQILRLIRLTEKVSGLIKWGGTSPLFTNCLSFLEIKIWQNVLDSFQIKQTKNSVKMVTNDGNFVVPFKEILFMGYVQIDQTNDSLIEIYLDLMKDKEPQDNKTNLQNIFYGFNNCKSIKYAHTSHQNIFIRYISLNKMTISQRKINLREIVNLFIADGFYKFQVNYMNSKLNLSDLQNLCNFIIYKIKSSNFANLLHDNSYNKKKKHTKTENIKFKQQLQDATQMNETIKSYQQVLNRYPQQIVKVEFVFKYEKVIISIFNQKNSSSWSLELGFHIIYEQFQQFYILLKQQNYNHLAMKIIELYRSKLIFESVFQFLLSQKN